nr:putative heat shock protein C, stationary phase growth adaptation protein [Pseudomonas sp.]
MTKPYFQPIIIGEEHFDLSHLEPFGFQVESKLAKRTLTVHVTFSNHCFSRKYKPERHTEGDLILDPDTPRPRTFCRIRHRLSKQLPELILGLNHPKCKVTQAASRRNWAYSIRIEDPAGPYYVFFEISRAVQAGRQKQDLNLVVESAYHDDPSEPDPVLLGDMAFLILCGKTYLRQPVATKR